MTRAGPVRQHRRSGEFRAALLASAALCSGGLGTPARAGDLPVEPSTRSTRLTLPLIYEGAYRGDVPVTIRADGSVRVVIAQLVALLGGQLSRDAAARITAAQDDIGLIELTRLNAAGVKASYDPGTLQLNVSVPVVNQGRTVLSVSAGEDASRHSFLKASGVSASAILSATQRRVWEQAGESKGFKPVQLSADISANIGGPGGISLFTQLELDTGTDKLRRGTTQLIHDDTKRAIRFTFGDTAATPTDLQTAPLIGGVTLERAYGLIQPLRNIRPSGQLNFVLDKPARVDVVVNGARLKTLPLAPGQYSMADFSFFNGLNDVELYVEDDQGRRLLTKFSQYFSAQLLDSKVFDFGLSAGFLQNFSGSGPRYLTKRPVSSGYLRYGVTSSLTIGANYQAGRDQYMVGGEAALATPLGTFSGVYATSRKRQIRSGRALIAAYEGSIARLGPFRSMRFNAEWRKTSREFTGVSLTPTTNPLRQIMQGRVSTRFGKDWTFGAAYADYDGRDEEPDRKIYSGSFSRSFGRLGLTGSLDRIVSQDKIERRGLVSLVLRLGRSQSLRSTYDTREHTGSLEYAKFERDQIGGTGLRANVTRTRSSVDVSGDLAYNANRFRAFVQHRLITAPGLKDVRANETSYTISTQLAVADGTLAIGRPVGPNFAVIAPHHTLSSSSVMVENLDGRRGARTKSSAFGPALADAGSAYSPNRIKIAVDRLPAGYDLGPSQYDLQPGSATGYKITIGSDAARLLIGIALGPTGAPIAQQGGTVHSLDRPAEPPVLLFTNRNGRFVATGLRPGRYRIELGPRGEFQAALEVPKAGNEAVMLGPLRFSEGPGQEAGIPQ